MTPFPYQEQPIKVLAEAVYNNRAAIDGSDCGLGKTVVSLMAIKPSGLPAAVICSKSAIPAWKETAEAIGVPLLFASNIERLKADQQVLRGDGLRWRWDLPRAVLIYDEAHRASGFDSENGAILATAPRPVLMLTATIADDPTKLRAVVHQLGLARWDDFWSWCGRQGCVRGRFGGVEFSPRRAVVEERETELDLTCFHRVKRPRGYQTGKKVECKTCRQEILQKLHQQLFDGKRGVRVQVSDVPDYPKNFIETVSVPVEDQAAIDQAYKAELEALENAAPNPGVQMLRARQISEHQKLASVIDLTDELLGNGRSVAIFVNFRDSLKRLVEKFGAPYIHGDQTPDERGEAMKAFQANRTRVIALMIQAGGESISLPDLDGQHPRTELIMPGLSARELIQASWRSCRATSKSPSQVKIVFADGTLESRIRRNLDKKIIGHAIINDGLTDDELTMKGKL